MRKSLPVIYIGDYMRGNRRVCKVGWTGGPPSLRLAQHRALHHPGLQLRWIVETESAAIIENEFHAAHRTFAVHGAAKVPMERELYWMSDTSRDDEVTDIMYGLVKAFLAAHNVTAQLQPYHNCRACKGLAPLHCHRAAPHSRSLFVWFLLPACACLPGDLLEMLNANSKARSQSPALVC